ncbi:MAG TPA: branched-chain amino acid ABC transporter permease [Archaeoglobus profundus]|nr:branched-chain amino acid ABC transporter permease [Archaeoglobus profundus]
MDIIQFFINGVIMGGIYALIALGFVLIYKASKVLNFAQGELVMVGAFSFLAFYSVLPLWLALLLTIVLAGLIGFLIERIVLRPLIGEPILSVIMVTLALSYLMRGIILTLFGPDIKPFPQFISGSIEFGEIVIPKIYLAGFLTSIAVIIIFLIFFKKTILGITMRAAADDQIAAMSLGVSVEKMFAIAWAISAIVATIGGILLGNIFGGINPNLSYIGLKVFAVVILGGLDSIAGAIIGGIIIGICESVIGGMLEPIVGGGFKDVVPLIIMLFIMTFKPYGLFGTERIERV